MCQNGWLGRNEFLLFAFVISFRDCIMMILKYIFCVESCLQTIISISMESRSFPPHVSYYYSYVHLYSFSRVLCFTSQCSRLSVFRLYWSSNGHGEYIQWPSEPEICVLSHYLTQYKMFAINLLLTYVRLRSFIQLLWSMTMISWSI